MGITGLIRRMRHDAQRGTSSLEMVGLAMVAGIVVVGITVGLGGGGAPRVREAICRALSTILQQDLGCQSDTTAGKQLNLPDCDVTSSEYAMALDGTAFSVNIGANLTGTLRQVRTKGGNSSWAVDFEVGGKLGAQMLEGVKGDLGPHSQGYAGGVGAAVTADGGLSWEFGSQQEALDFVNNASKELAKRGAAFATGPFSVMTKWTLDEMSGGSYDLPSPNSAYVQLGAEGSASAEYSKVLEASADISLASAVGVKVEQLDKPMSERTYTAYYKASGELSAQLGITSTLRSTGGTGAADSEVMVGVTYVNGKPIEASIEGAGQVSAGWFPSLQSGDIPMNPPSLKVAVEGLVSTQSTVSGQVKVNLDLNEPKNMSAFADVMHSTGMPILSGYGTPGHQRPGVAVGALITRFVQGGPAEGASIMAQRLDGSTSEMSVGIQGGEVVTFGINAEGSMRQLSATEATYYDPETRQWATLLRCVA